MHPFSTGGSLIFTALINSIVHIFMYTYYFLALFGPSVQAKLIWFKKSITIIQIVQFLLLLTNAVVATIPSCDSPKWFLAFYIPNIMLLLLMFVKFYIQSYLRKKSAVHHDAAAAPLKTTKLQWIAKYRHKFYDAKRTKIL